MTIKELTYQLWRRLSKGDIPDDTPHTYLELSLYVRQGLAIALKGNYYEVINNSDYKYNTADVTTTTIQTVKTDVATGLKYVDIPHKSVAVSSTRMLSITSVNPVSSTAVRYIPVRDEEVSVGRLQPPIPCVVLFYKDDNKAFFYNNEVKDTKVKVNQKYALPVDDNAEISIPEAGSIIIENALRLMGQLPQVSDRNNDGVPIV